MVQKVQPIAPGVPGNPPANHGVYYFRDDGGTVKFYYKRPNGTEVELGAAGSGTDPDAIHDNVSGEIAVVTEKGSPISADLILIEDSAASNAKKRVQIGNLPGFGGTDADAIHDNVSGEISAITEKATPISADLLLIEDSEATNAKKRVQIGNLPGGVGGGDSTYTAVYGSRPAASNDGDLFFPSNGFFVERDTGASWAPWGPLFPLTPPPVSGWSWVNQGGASVSTTNGGISMTVPLSGTHNVRIYARTAPTPPYTITACFLVTRYRGPWHAYGLGFRQSSDGKLHTLMDSMAGGANNVNSFKWTNPTTTSASYVAGDIGEMSPMWMQISDNNTSRICRFSSDGVNFMTHHTVGRTDFLTADQVFFFGDTFSGSFPMYINLISWKES